MTDVNGNVNAGKSLDYNHPAHTLVRIPFRPPRWQLRSHNP
jgi:hypothetical protein